MTVPVVESGFTYNSASASGSVALTKPTGVGVGDLLLLIVMNDNNTNNAQFSAFTDGAGKDWEKWGEAGDSAADCHVAFLARQADGGEGATVTVNATNSANIQGWYVRISGNRLLGTALHKKSDTVSLNSGTSAQIPSMDTDFKDCLIIEASAYDGADTTSLNISGTGWSQQDFQRLGTGSASIAGQWGTKDMATPGNTGVVTVTSTIADGHAGLQVAIAREGAPPTSIKEAVLQALDAVWEHRNETEQFTAASDLFEESGEYFQAHGYSRQNNDNCIIRIKDKGAV